MLVDEATRHDVHNRLEGLLGAKHAGTLMSMLPNVDWDQVVTKDYLDLRLVALEERMALRQEALEERLTGRIERSERRTLVVMVTVIGGVQLTMIGAVAALIATFLSRMP